MTQFYNATASANEVKQEFPDPELSDGLKTYLDAFGGTGLIPLNNGALRDGCIIQYTIGPARGNDPKTWEQDGVQFDEARQFQDWWYQDKGAGLNLFLSHDFRRNPDNTLQEEVNYDDRGNSDESDVVTPTGHFYSYDAPGITQGAAGLVHEQYIINLRDFLRVEIDGGRPTGELDGSRCSDYIPWYSVADAYEDGAGNILPRDIGNQSNVAMGWSGAGPY